VQEAFYDTDQVLTISLHESGETLFPGTGFPYEMGWGKGKGYSVNLPLYPGTDDEIFLWALEEIVPPLLSSFAPDVLVTQLGIDTHRTDPLANLSLTLQGYARAVTRVRGMARKWVALGGGGYNLNNVPRAWALVWAIMNGRELDPAIPQVFLEAARPFGFTEKSLWDPPATESEFPREAAEKYAEKQVGIVKETIFPLRGIKG
jgi:acetoin utilization protein AcuC